MSTWRLRPRNILTLGSLMLGVLLAGGPTLAQRDLRDREIAIKTYLVDPTAPEVTNPARYESYIYGWHQFDLGWSLERQQRKRALYQIRAL